MKVKTFVRAKENIYKAFEELDRCVNEQMPKNIEIVDITDSPLFDNIEMATSQYIVRRVIYNSK